MKLFIKILIVLVIGNVQGQNIGINTSGITADPSAMLDISSTSSGLLIPRVSLTGSGDVTTILSPATSLMIYNTASISDVTPGFYYWNGSTWERIMEYSSITGWDIEGNSGTINGTNFLGTIDSVNLDIRTNNLIRVRITNQGQIETLNNGESVFIGEFAGASDDLTNNHNDFIGFRAGQYNTYGYRNNAIGTESMRFNTIGSYGTALGYAALRNNTTGFYSTAIGAWALYAQSWDNGGATWGAPNTAVGYAALYNNNSIDGITAIRNTAVGYYALNGNTLGARNTAVGYVSQQYNSTGGHNTSVGSVSLYSNTNGSGNTAVGSEANRYNTTGNLNSSLGYLALYNCLTGSYNVAIGSRALLNVDSSNGSVGVGYQALYINTSGEYNVGIGYQAAYLNSSGSGHVAIGRYALFDNTTGNSNTALGYNSLASNTTGSNNSAVGINAFSSGTTYSNSTALGANSVITASDQVRIGSAAVTSIGGIVGWTTLSDQRFKYDVQENVPGLNFIMELKPITYKLDIEKIGQHADVPDSIIQVQNSSTTYSGFKAQEVESIAQRLGYDFHGVDSPENDNDYYGLRYSEFVVPLVKSVQEQQEIIEELLIRIKTLEAKLGDSE